MNDDDSPLQYTFFAVEVGFGHRNWGTSINIAFVPFCWQFGMLIDTDVLVARIGPLSIGVSKSDYPLSYREGM